jgi:hypothetical protein
MEDTKELSYRGKHYTIPDLGNKGFSVVPEESRPKVSPPDSPIIQALNQTWDLKHFLTPRKPISLGFLPNEERMLFSTQGMPRTLDLPIKFPGSEFRVPSAFQQLKPLIQRVANYEAEVNADCYDEYYCYMTVDQALVKKGVLQREAPCHVDGFQGARWNPKVRNNHTYVISDAIPTVYYAQPFDVTKLDEAKHNFFWEFNRQVALTNSEFAWKPEAYELNMMDCYTVHRGDNATEDTYRTWVRLSFEVRIFDRLGNAHNPLFQYNWAMVPRDIEGLHLEVFEPNADPSLHVFPWQKTDGSAYEDRKKRTQPNLKPRG